MKSYTESQIQKALVLWFRERYPTIGGAFHSVPNGGARNVWTGKILKDEGAVRGVADLELLVPRKGYASLSIELKKDGGRLSKEQKQYEKDIEKWKNKYVVCYSLEEAQNEIKKYLEE